ncbi:MAG TPA: HNH endonuclease [Cyanothece sp. UBA12306]|nr:HNH endonuclease [Cyanothece sp. UBA12306]
MKNKDIYPDNWDEIALEVKIKYQWKCAKCGLQCLSPNEKEEDKSLKAKRTLNVHHSDYDPSNNHLFNLIPLCSACHLYAHRGKRRNITPGQLKLELGL